MSAQTVPTFQTISRPPNQILWSTRSCRHPAPPLFCSSVNIPPPLLGGGVGGTLVPPNIDEKKLPPMSPLNLILIVPNSMEIVFFHVFELFLNQDLFRKCQKRHFSGGACGGLKKSRISDHFQSFWVFGTPKVAPPILRQNRKHCSVGVREHFNDLTEHRFKTLHVKRVIAYLSAAELFVFQDSVYQTVFFSFIYFFIKFSFGDFFARRAYCVGVIKIRVCVCPFVRSSVRVCVHALFGALSEQ